MEGYVSHFPFYTTPYCLEKMHNMITELGFLNGTPVSGLHGRIFLIKMNWLVFREQVFPVVLGIYGT